MGYSNHDICYLARIVLEATTPLKIGSGNKNIKTDAVINTDVNSLPYIPATTIKGILRHAMTDGNKVWEDNVRDMMGFQSDKRDKDGNKIGQGSWLSITDAIIVGADGNAVDGLRNRQEILNDAFLENFRQMPIRQHVRITDKGTAADKGKFDEEIIPKGVRFCFEMELRADETAREEFNSLLETLRKETFRIGGGSRKGFGAVKVVKLGYKELNFKDPADFDLYVKKSSNLSTPWVLSEYEKGLDTTPNQNATRYELKLNPVDYIMFSSGFGDERADMTVVKEPFVEWSADDRPRWIESEKSLVIPATSVKGAISHRTAFYYNQAKGNWAEEIKDTDSVTGKNNQAVFSLFGSEGVKSEGKTTDKKRGRVLFSDLIKERQSGSKSKVINHVKIDRFTGGAIDGALFAEDPLYANDEDITLNVIVLQEPKAKGQDGTPVESKEDPDIIPSLEKALIDISADVLPLGGGVNRGNGCFKGKLTRVKNGETKVLYDSDK